MNTTVIRVFQKPIGAASVCLLALAAFCETASSPEGNALRAITLPSAAGNVDGWVQDRSWPRTAAGSSAWTTTVHTIYLPDTGNSWAGTIEDKHVLVEDRIFGFYYDAQRNRETLRISVSTNSYSPHVQHVSAIMNAEFECFTNGASRLVGGPQFFVYPEKLLGSASVRDHPDTNGTKGIYFFSATTRPSKLKSVTVEATNAVVALEFGTNVAARIAFDKAVRPVWATVNGAPIDPIPTNTVVYVDVVDNREVVKVVY